jgi:uncharacterized protein (DUF3820 family)
MQNNITPELASALVKAIAETKDVKADATNPFHKNTYATLGAHLEATKGTFAKHGLAIVQFPHGDGNQVGVNTMVIHKDGGYIQNYVTIPVGENLKGQDAGSLFSYLRRYALASVAGIATTDDDAEADRVLRSAPSTTHNTGVFAQPATKVVSAPSGVIHADADLNVVIHFGKNKGKTLGELPANSLDWYIKEFQPKPYNGKISPVDVALRDALDRLDAKRGDASSDEPEDNVPF